MDAERIAFWRSRPLRSDVVLYESFAGNGMLCNPEAIFRHLLDHPDFAHLSHVWAIGDDAAARRFRSEFSGNPRVSMVRRGGTAYWREVSTAGYLINNATFPPAFGKRPGQIYLNTWHGTPLKLMGFDMPDGAYESANTLRNLLASDYVLAANPFMAETMYESAYRLINVHGGRIIEEGYPRIDRQSMTDASSAALRQELEDAGVRVGQRRIVLFAPTWRGSSFSRPQDDLEELARQVAQLQSAFDDDTVVLLKTHQIVHSFASSLPQLAGVLLPNTIPTNVLLGAAGGLITDYSSIFFDYLATGRPIAFFTPDADAYGHDRGTYLPLDQLPGPVSDDPREVGRQLRTLMDGSAPHANYREWAERFVPFDDGHATQRVVDVVFRGRSDGYRVRPFRSDGRRRLLFFAGGMRSNGITSSALNLLDAIDHSAYDVTVVTPYFTAGAPRQNQALINPAVRVIFRQGGMNGSKFFHLRRRVADWRGTPLEPRTEDWHEELWDDEWSRVFGAAGFDWVADFSGYSPFWANLVLHAPNARHAIWLHNEMAADRERTVGGKQRMKRSLGVVFELYGAFDELVSVSPGLTELNRSELAAYAPADHFATVRNLPNPRRVAEGVAQPLDELVDAGTPAPRWLQLMQNPRHPDEKWFVAVGRLSPEKNHARLIRAFADVHARAPHARLVIVGGGPLEHDLQRQISHAHLDDAVFLTGEQRNPFAIMASADCFVLSSTYEGQPMVLIEAALCDLPIVSTSFASVEDALPAGVIHVVAQDDEALRDGMLAFLDGDVAASHLDIERYTADVMAEFESIVAPSRREPVA